MEKQAPQKALCLGPDPPLGFSIKFIKIMVFFGFWAFNTAGKSVTKVGIYALPPLGGPQKVTIFEKYRFLMISTHGSGNNLRSNFNDGGFLNKIYLINWVAIN
jgi:hypothetical protein